MSIRSKAFSDGAGRKKDFFSLRKFPQDAFRLKSERKLFSCRGGLNGG